MQAFPWHILVEWYRENGRSHLPWREYNHNDKTRLYRIWLSEIFLQQTQVDRVIGYFGRVTEQFPDIETLAWTDYDTFFPYYQGMGYYSRARNLLKTARIVHEDFDGYFPQEKNILKKLPWIGDYTARAILSFGYGESYLAWDTNLEKVFSRYYFGTKDRKLTDQEKEYIEADFQVFISESSAEESTQTEFVRAVNNGLMDFSSIVDLKNPEQIDWENYPIKSGKWYETRGTLENSEKAERVVFPTADAKVVVVLHENHKTYFSLPWSAAYTPFMLDPALHNDTRKHVQDFFRTTYRLELSVRPASKKWLSESGEPFVLVNAQIQAWDGSLFSSFSKSEYQEWKKGIEKL